MHPWKAKVLKIFLSQLDFIQVDYPLDARPWDYHFQTEVVHSVWNIRDDSKMLQGSGSLNFLKNFRKMSLKSSLKLQLFRVCIPSFFCLEGSHSLPVPILGGFLTVMYTYIYQWVLICLSLQWIFSLWTKLSLVWVNRKSIIFDWFTFRIVPNFFLRLQKVQGSHP